MWVALGASLWGTDTVLRRQLTGSSTSFQIVLGEHLILALVLVLALPAWQRYQWLGLNAREWGAVLGISWGGSALGSICFTEAIRTGNPSTAVLLQKTQPVFAALLARLLLGEPLGRRFWVCLGLALCGVYLVSFGAAWPRDALMLTGVTAPLLALVAAVLWGGSTVLGRLVLRRVPYSTLTALRILFATPLLLALNLAAGQPLPRLDGRQVLWLLLLAMIPGLLALLVYYRGLGGTRASLAAVAELSFPATAVLLNWLILGARINTVQVAGFVLLWGVILHLGARQSP